MQLVTNRGERFDRERLIEVLTEFPEVRSIHWSVNTGVSEVTNLPTELLWGEDAIEEEIGGLRYPRAAERVPPDEHRDGRASCTGSRASSPGSPAARRCTTCTAGSGRSASRWLAER